MLESVKARSTCRYIQKETSISAYNSTVDNFSFYANYNNNLRKCHITHSAFNVVPHLSLFALKFNVILMTEKTNKNCLD